jgi:hypothetical protein
VARHTQVSQALQQQITVHQIVSLSEVHKASVQLASPATRDTCAITFFAGSHVSRQGTQCAASQFWACQIDKAPMFVPTVCLTECSILINCAGRFLDEHFKLTREGIEQILALDYYAHVLLSLRLIDTLTTNGPSRIINVSRCASADAAPRLAAS